MTSRPVIRFTVQIRGSVRPKSPTETLPVAQSVDGARVQMTKTLSNSSVAVTGQVTESTQSMESGTRVESRQSTQETEKQETPQGQDLAVPEPGENDSSGIVTKDMRFTDDDNSLPELRLDELQKVDGAKPVSVSNQASASGIPHPAVNELLRPATWYQEKERKDEEVHFKREQDELDLRREILEPVHPVKPKLRKCCDCCPRNRSKSAKPVKCPKTKPRTRTKSNQKPLRTMVRDEDDSTIGSTRFEMANGLAPTSSMDHHGQKSIRERDQWPQEVRCPACTDLVNVFVAMADTDKDDTFTTAVEEEWRQQLKAQQKYGGK